MPQVPQFPGAPPERRNADDIRTQREAVDTQMAEWLKKIGTEQDARADRVRAFASANDRRAEQQRPRFDADDDVLVDPDRVVVPVADLASARAQLSATVRTDEEWIPGLDDVCVVTGPGIGRPRGTQLRLLAEPPDPVAATPVYLVPMGAVRKADGGPELSGPARDQNWARAARGPARAPRVVVIDTGVAAERRADGWLDGLAAGDNVDPLNVEPFDDYLDLGAGHGPFVTGIVQQIAPDTDVDVRRQIDSSGFGAETGIAAAIVAAAREGAQIVNLSLGTVTSDGRPPEVLKSALRAAIAVAPEILFVCAAGNYADEREVWPAAFSADPEFGDHVVSVAALRLDPAGDTEVVGADWSSRGGWVTCSTLGQGVVSTYVTGQEVPQPPPLRQDTFGPDAWATWSGTSFAAPQIVGAIAWTMQQDGWTGRPLDALREVLAGGADVISGYGTSIRILPV